MKLGSMKKIVQDVIISPLHDFYSSFSHSIILKSNQIIWLAFKLDLFIYWVMGDVCFSLLGLLMLLPNNEQPTPAKRRHNGLFC